MIITLDDLAEVKSRHSNQKIILTSGTFDLFHVGHLDYLERAKQYGDVLIVLLSSDARVRARKGATRPIIPENDRAKIMDALGIVDYVLIDPSKLSPDMTDPVYADIISRLCPDMYVTDGEDIRFSKLLDTSRLAILPRSHVVTSTTDIIKRIVESTGK